MHDLIIRNGRIVDGTGTEPDVGDIAIDGNIITGVGEISAAATREIDATGDIVTPGFIDLHTHLDAQIGWDPMLTPISWHGVTTVLMGNCGVTFAPCRPGDREFLAGMMEMVEDIPRRAILEGLPWNWESYGGYLNSLQAMGPAINVAGLVGHSAVRQFVMGERSVDEQPTQEEKSEMSRIVGQAMAEGAHGFSTSRFLGHYLPDGRHIPGTYAEHDELALIARVVGEKDGLMQNILNTANEFENEMNLLRKEAEFCRVIFSHGTGQSTGYTNKLDARVMAMRADGLDVNAMAFPRSSGLVSNLHAWLPWTSPLWEQLKNMDKEERLAAISNPDFAAQLVAEARADDGLVANDEMFYLGNADTPNYLGKPELSLQSMAESAREHPAQTFLRLSRDSAGQAFFLLRFFNKNLKIVGDAISNEFCLPGLGDTGAHVGQIMDSGWTTFTLSHWHRDTGLFSLQEVVRRLSSAPAQLIGLRDRGQIKAGMKADINVIELQSLAERMPSIVNDFPFGASRLIQKARGYKSTICNGQLILENDEHTGTRVGSILRH